MALPGNKDFNEYDNYVTDPNPTTSAQAQDYFRNQAELLKAVIDCDFWQPETVYQPGDVVKSDSMPNGTEAVMVATKASVTSNVEPQWGAVGGANISDGACFWKLRWQHWSKDIIPIANGGTGATTAANARKNLSVNTQTFTEVSQLGLMAATTELEIAAAMPSNSVFIQGVNKTNNPNLQVYSDSTVATYGRLFVTKVASNNFVFEYFGSEGGGYWFATGNSSVTKLKYYKSFVLDNGYVTKNLLFNDNAVIINNKKDYYLGLFGDSQTWNIGALLALYGSEHSTNAGNFILRARSGQGNRTLQGKPDGSLTWDGKGIALEGSLSMPSSNQINLSLASGDTYTAPADGWLFLRVTAPSSSTYCDLIVQNTTSGIQTRQRDNQGLNLRAYVPLAKGQVGKVEYTNGTLHTAIFVYAQSEV